jgi:hypothetical protein
MIACRIIERIDRNDYASRPIALTSGFTRLRSTNRAVLDVTREDESQRLRSRWEHSHALRVILPAMRVRLGGVRVQIGGTLKIFSYMK